MGEGDKGRGFEWCFRDAATPAGVRGLGLDTGGVVRVLINHRLIAGIPSGWGTGVELSLGGVNPVGPLGGGGGGLSEPGYNGGRALGAGRGLAWRGWSLGEGLFGQGWRD